MICENGNLPPYDMMEDCRFPHYVIYFKLVDYTVIYEQTVLQILTVFLPDACDMQRIDGGTTYALVGLRLQNNSRWNC